MNRNSTATDSEMDTLNNGLKSNAQKKDQAAIKGIPWSELEKKLEDPGFDKEAFMVSELWFTDYSAAISGLARLPTAHKTLQRQRRGGKEQGARGHFKVCYGLQLDLI